MNTNRIKELANRYPILRAILLPAILLRRPFIKMKVAWKTEVVNNFSELLVEDPVIRVDEFGGVFAIDSRSDLFARVVINKEYEPKFIKYCLKHIDPERDIIDVGANVGFYSVLFAKQLKTGRVVAVEPTQNALKRLRRNIEMNGVNSRVDIFEGVVSDNIGQLEINTIAGKEEYSSIGVLQQSPVTGLKHVTEKVKSTTLDELVKSKSLNPAFIKIDVEGAENLVFKGARNVLMEKRPIILSEISDTLLRANGSSSEEVVKLLKECKYDVFDVGNPSGQVKVSRSEFEHILCTPSELAIKFKA